MPPIVALLTDFGEEDAYAGVLKGVLLRLEPALRLVDLTHRVEPFNVLSAAYLLLSAWDHFPPGTVFLAVVDPGVGTARGALAAQADERLLIAPDNGTVSLLLRRKPGLRAWRLREEGLPTPPAAGDAYGEDAARTAARSSTFHGRDIFAPAAARAAAGGLQAVRGEEIRPVTLPEAWPERDPAGTRLAGRILHVDRFGNCISSLHRDDLSGLGAPFEKLRVRLGRARLAGLRRTYGEAPPGGLLACLGSSGFLEVAVREGSAARRLRVQSGARIEVTGGSGAPAGV